MLGLIIRAETKYWHMTTLLSRVLSSLALCLWSLHPATAFTKDQLDICMVPEAGSLMMMVGDDEGGGG